MSHNPAQSRGSCKSTDIVYNVVKLLPPKMLAMVIFQSRVGMANIKVLVTVSCFARPLLQIGYLALTCNYQSLDTSLTIAISTHTHTKKETLYHQLRLVFYWSKQHDCLSLQTPVR